MADEDSALPDPSEQIRPRRRNRPRASVTIEGDAPADSVEKALALGAKKDSRDGEVGPVRFAEAIRNPENRITAKRRTPEKTAEGKILGDEYQFDPTEDLSEDEIKRELAENRGGDKWTVRVMDPAGKVVSSKTLRVPGPPILDPLFGGFGQPDQVVEEEDQGPPIPEEELVEQEIARSPEVVQARRESHLLELRRKKLEKETELEEAQMRMEEARHRRDLVRRGKDPDVDDGQDEGGKIEDAISRAVQAAVGPFQDRIARYEERDRERDRRDDFRAQIEAATAPLKALVEEQKRAIERLSERPREDTSLKDVLREMRQEIENSRRDSSDRLTTAISGLKDSFTAQQNASTQQLLALLSKGGDDKIAAAAVSALSNLAGKGGPAVDPFAAVGRVVDSMKGILDLKSTMEGPSSIPRDFPSLIVEKMSELTPEVLGFMERQQAKGIAVSKEMMETRMKELGMQMWKELDKTLKTEVQGGFERLNQAARGLPAPAAPHPGQAPQAAPAQPAPQQQQATAIPPIDQDKAHRINHVLKVLQREMELEVEQMNWPRVAWEVLSRDVRDRIVVARVDKDIYEAVQQWGDPALLEAVWSFLKPEHPKHQWYRQWIVTGINWIKDVATGNAPEPQGAAK